VVVRSIDNLVRHLPADHAKVSTTLKRRLSLQCNPHHKIREHFPKQKKSSWIGTENHTRHSIDSDDRTHRISQVAKQWIDSAQTHQVVLNKTIWSASWKKLKGADKLRHSTIHTHPRVGFSWAYGMQWIVNWEAD